MSFMKNISDALGGIGGALNPIMPIVSTAMGAINALGSKSEAEKINDANRELSSAQMAFQERMSNTAHTREIQDLKNAGLNPVLSANGGASSPSGSMAVMLNPSKDIPANVQAGFTNAIASSLAKEQIITQKSIQNSNDAAAAKSRADAIRSLQEVNIKSPQARVGEAVNYLLDSFGNVVFNSAKGVYEMSDRVRNNFDEYRSGIRFPRRRVEVYPAK